MTEKIKLNIRGTLFITRYATLQRIPSTRLSRLTKESQEYESVCDEYFFDRDPTYFNWILEIYRSREMHVPAWVCPTRALQELDFWEITEPVQPCCWKILFENDNETLKLLLQKRKSKHSQIHPGDFDKARAHDKPLLRKRVLSLLRNVYDKPFRTTFGKVCFVVVFFITILSVIVYALNSQAGARVIRSDDQLRTLMPIFSRHSPNPDHMGRNVTSGDDNKTTPSGYKPTNSVLDLLQETWSRSRIHRPSQKVMLYLTTRKSQIVLYIEVIVNILLLVELVIRLAISTSKLRFLTNPFNICEFLAISSVFVWAYVDNYPAFFVRPDTKEILLILGLMYSARVLRIIQLARYAEEMEIMWFSLKTSLRELCFLFLCFSSFSVLFGSLMFSFELFNPDSFDNVFISIWWAVITMTTVGYGDEYPRTAQGYVLGSITAIFGIILLAMPIAVLSSNFNRCYHCFKLKGKAEQYSNDQCINRRMENGHGKLQIHELHVMPLHCKTKDAS